jgi:hypothetical protein
MAVDWIDPLNDPPKPSSPSMKYFWNFFSITNCARIIPNYLARFHLNLCRTQWDMGESVAGIKNCPKQIRAFGTAISCNKYYSVNPWLKFCQSMAGLKCCWLESIKMYKTLLQSNVHPTGLKSGQCKIWDEGYSFGGKHLVVLNFCDRFEI